MPTHLYETSILVQSASLKPSLKEMLIAFVKYEFGFPLINKNLAWKKKPELNLFNSICVRIKKRSSNFQVVYFISKRPIDLNERKEKHQY